MAITIELEETRSISVEEYMHYVERYVDPNDDESIMESALMLKALQNNRSFLVEYYNSELIKTMDRRLQYYLSPQSYVLSSSKDGRFVLRSNIWTVPSEHKDQREMESRLFSYNMAHDHNFNFLTVGYYGPGYETILYEYNSSDYLGYIGEPVNLKFLERTKLPQGKLMYYRAAKDLHIQLPPESLSISLNLLLNVPENIKRGQYYVNPENKDIIGYPEGNLASRRVSLLEFAKHFRDENTLDIVEHLVDKTTCNRAKIAGIETLVAANDNVTATFEKYSSHNDEFIRKYAMKELRLLEKGSHILVR